MLLTLHEINQEAAALKQLQDRGIVAGAETRKDPDGKLVNLPSTYDQAKQLLATAAIQRLYFIEGQVRAIGEDIARRTAAENAKPAPEDKNSGPEAMEQARTRNSAGFDTATDQAGVGVAAPEATTRVVVPTDNEAAKIIKQHTKIHTVK